jgi:hypothetical protein
MEIQQPQWSTISNTDNTGDISPGAVLIKWKTHSFNNYPISGLGEYYPSGDKTAQGTTVFFLAFGLKPDNDQSTLVYLLYQLSPSSLQQVQEEHQRFYKEVGGINDYGKLFSTDIPSSDKVVSFKHNINIIDLQVTIVGRIKYSQFLNKTPTMII